MTVIAKRTEQGLRLKGGEDELRALLVEYVATGRLTREGLLAQGVLRDGRCYADVQLLPLPTPRRREVSPEMAAAGLVALTVLVAAAWLVFLLGHLKLVAVMVLVLLLWVGLGRVGVCPGVHCPGCKHR
jgi:hypothetical protein